ncbi:MAG TPA: hypothetical protein V6C86_05290 [Oculatellaceae cyanobacterium]
MHAINCRQPWRRLWLGAILLSLFSVQSLPAVSKESTSIKLLQRSKLNGDMVVYLSQSGLRIENPRSHITMFAKPPEWTVYKVSQETKKYRVLPFQSYSNPIVQAQIFAAGINMTKATCAKTGSAKMFELPVDLYKSDEAYTKNAHEMYYKTKIVSASYPETFTCKVLSPDAFPAEEARILSILNGLPNLHGVPVEMTCMPFDRKILKYLGTSDAIPCTLSPEQLTLPRGFQKVDEDSALTTSVEVQKDMLDFIESAGQRKSK